MLLREEMRRVLRYLKWQAAWWRQWTELRTDWSTAVAAGGQAYAQKQANWHDHLAEFFQAKWNALALTTAQEFVDGEDGFADLFE